MVDRCSDKKAVIALHMDSAHHHTALLTAAVSGICHQYAMSEKKIWQVELSLTECINNIIQHAYNNQAGKPIDVSVTLLEQGIEIILYDRGASLSEMILNEPVVLMDNNPKNPKVHGRGLYLVRTLMDSFTYITTNEGINQQILFKTFL